MNQKPFLTEDEVHQALTEFSKRTGKHECPVCNNSTWEIETQVDVETARILPLPGLIGYRSTTNHSVAPTTPTLVITCDNCGYVRMHSIPMLLRKAGERTNGQ